MKKDKWFYIFGILVLSSATIWLAVFSIKPQKLRLIACDVGQGDAILAVYGETDILVDGGSGKKVLDCLSKYLPFYDKKIELVVLTHPQTDHYEGLISVFRDYKVDTLLANSLDSGNKSYQVLKDAVGGNGARVVTPTAGQVIRSGLIHLDVVHPSRAFLLANATKTDSETGSKVLGAYTSSEDPNNFSVVAILSLGDFDALLTGDAGPQIAAPVMENLSRLLVTRSIDYIKIPHHGSRNGLTQDLLEKIKPDLAVISAGRNNSYGHPHKEVLDMLKNAGVETVGTYETGDVVIESDGKTWQRIN